MIWTALSVVVVGVACFVAGRAVGRTDAERAAVAAWLERHP